MNSFVSGIISHCCRSFVFADKFNICLLVWLRFVTPSFCTLDQCISFIPQNIRCFLFLVSRRRCSWIMYSVHAKLNFLLLCHYKQSNSLVVGREREQKKTPNWNILQAICGQMVKLENTTITTNETMRKGKMSNRPLVQFHRSKLHHFKSMSVCCCCCCLTYQIILNGGIYQHENWMTWCLIMRINCHAVNNDFGHTLLSLRANQRRKVTSWLRNECERRSKKREWKNKTPPEKKIIRPGYHQFICLANGNQGGEKRRSVIWAHHSVQ